MTRRAFARAGKVLSLNAYVHRATLGLPKTERLDAAAELRVHLLEQVAVLEAKGFAREEAEFLAVQAMGTVRLGSRSSLSRTRVLGWTVLGLMSLATGSWWVYSNLMPLREGIEVTDGNLTPDDMARLWNNPDAPHGFNYNSAVLTYPKATRTIYYAYVTPNHVVIQSNALSTVNEYDVSKRWPGSYRYQERWLVSSQEGSTACPQDWNLFLSVWAINSPLSFTDGSAGYPPDLNLKKAGPESSVCTGIKHLPITAASSSEIRVITGGVLPPIYDGTQLKPLPLPLGRWTILHQLMTISKGQRLRDLPQNYNNSMYLAVLPSEQAASVSDSTAVFKRDANGKITNLTYGGQPLPDPPAGTWEQIRLSSP